MTEGLFRKEFLEARARADFGEVTLPPQRAVRIAAVCSLTVIALLLGVLAWLPYTRVETGRGFVVSDAESIAVTSAFKHPVRIDSILAGSGQLATPGTPLLAVSLDGGTAGLGDESSSNSRVSITDMAAVTGDSTRPPIATLMSSRQGYVDKFLVAPGDRVATGQPIVLLRRHRGRIAFRALADARSIGFLKPGREVFIRVEAYPFQRFGSIRGHITGLSDSPVSPSQAAALFGIPASNRGGFLVDVAVDDPGAITGATGGAIGGAQALRPGMSAFIDFPMEEMSVLRWVFSSLLRTGGRDGR